ncbi:MAG: hypothetical protein GX802_07620 [Clostridiales bacterium]|nr:hypothetical protein [Clostridiales bacterium]
MNPKVEEYINRKRKEVVDRQLRERIRILDDAGLCERKYVKEKTPETFWDAVKEKHYIPMPYEVTDEEFEEVKKYAVERTKAKPNAVASALHTIAILIYFLAFLVGSYISAKKLFGDISFFITLLYWGAGFVVGTIHLGFAEIIKLLQNLNNKD